MQFNQWECICEQGMPTPKSGHCCCIVQNYLYVFAGQTNQEVLNEFHRFDLKEKIWQKIKAEQQPQGRSSATICGSEELMTIYLFGGTQFIVEKTCKNDLYQFSIKEQKWTIIQSNLAGPCERYGHSMLLHNYQIYIFGGVHYIKASNRMNPEFLNDLWVFSLIDKMWKKIELRAQYQPQARYRHTTVIIENELYIIGGTTNQNRYGQVCKSDFINMQWNYLELEALKNKTKKNLFKGRYGHSSFVINNMVYIYGGMDDGLCDDALQLDVKSNKWQRKKFINYVPPRDFFAFAIKNNTLYIYGGKNQQNQRLNDLYSWTHEGNQQQQCTLREEIYSLLKIDNNCADFQVSTKTQFYFLHKGLLQVRCSPLLQNSNFEFSDILFQLLLKYIYLGEVDLQILNKVEIRETLQLCVWISDEIFTSLIIQYFLINCKNQQDYDFIEKEIQKNSQPIFKDIQYIFEQRKQKQLINLFQKERIIFNNLIQKSIDKFYDDMKKLQYSVQYDTIIQVQGIEIKVHSFLLMARSEYFRAMIHFEEGKQQLIQVDFNHQIVQNIINYLYCGYKALQKDQQKDFQQLIEAFKAQNYFMLNNQTFSYLLQQSMCQFICQESVYDLANLSEDLNAPFLLYECSQYISENLKGVNQENLKKLSKDVLIKILEVIGEKQ